MLTEFLCRIHSNATPRTPISATIFLSPIFNMNLDSIKLKIKEENVKGLEVGSTIWAGLDTFIDGSLEFTDFPMNTQQLSLNMVEG